MPRTRKPGSGGPRQGQPGRAYGNRTDLNASYTGQQYGQASAQQASMRSVPIQPPSGPSAPAPAPVASAPPPGSAGPFARPSERPGEPVTAGAPIGAGAGPEALGLDFRDPPEIAELRAIYRMFPTQDLAELLEDVDHGVTF